MDVSPGNPVSRAVLAKAINGDEQAIGELWRAWNPPLLRFFRSRRVVEPDDLAQQVWLEIARKLGDFEGDPDAFRRWLFTIAHRRMIDAARARQRRPAFAPLSERDDESTTRFDDDVDGLGWALSLLAELPEKQATAVALRILAGMAVDDVAEVMAEKPATVRVLTHRGLRRIERLLGVDRKRSDDRVTQRNVASLTPIT